MNNREIIFDMLSKELYDDALNYLKSKFDSKSEEYQALLEIITDLTPTENHLITVSLLHAELWDDLLFFMEEKYSHDSEYFLLITAIANYYSGKKLQSLEIINKFVSGNNNSEYTDCLNKNFSVDNHNDNKFQEVIIHLKETIILRSISLIEGE